MVGVLLKEKSGSLKRKITGRPETKAQWCTASKKEATVAFISLISKDEK